MRMKWHAFRYEVVSVITKWYLSGYETVVRICLVTKRLEIIFSIQVKHASVLGKLCTRRLLFLV